MCVRAVLLWKIRACNQFTKINIKSCAYFSVFSLSLFFTFMEYNEKMSKTKSLKFFSEHISLLARCVCHLIVLIF